MGSGAFGRCPDCGRIIAGRADGIQRLAADRKWVLLGPHNRSKHAGEPCLTRGARRRVPRVEAVAVS